MMMNNIIWMIAVFISYFSLYVLIPFWLRGFKLSGEKVLDKLVSTFLYSNIIIILAVIFLSLIGFYSGLAITITLLIIAIGYRYFFKRRQTLAALVYFKQYATDFAKGYYHPRVLMKDMLRKLRIFLRSVLYKIDNPIGLLFTLAIFGYGAYIRCYHSAVNLFFGSSDMYLHTEWIKYMMQNVPYISGVYPFGFHAVAAAVSSVFHINIVTVMQMLGPIVGMLTIFSLYYILSRTMRSAFAINIALAIYIVTDVFPYWASERQFLALPQEFGTIFLYLTAYFLFKYMKDKETGSLVSFSAAVSLTLLIHFFVTIYAVMICAAVFVSCLVYLNRKVFIRLVIGVICAFLIAFLPLGAGLVKGIEFNGSMGWALSVISGAGAEEEAAPEEAAPGEAAPEETIQSISDIYDTLVKEEYFDPSYQLSLFNLTWFLPYLAACFIALISPIFKFKGRGRQWIFSGFSMYSLLVCVLFILSVLNIFAIMEYSRLYVFFIYSIPLVIGVPFELLHNFLCKDKSMEGDDTAGGKATRVIYTVLITVIAGTGIFYVGMNERFMPLGRVWQSQYNGAVATYYKIVKKFPRNQWIIVSSMTEYTQCLFEGYHYQLIDFIMDMNDYRKTSELTVMDMEVYDETNELIMPAENVFIYIAKRPNTFLDTDLQRLGAFEPLPYLDKNDASVDLAQEYGANRKGQMIHIYRNYDANCVLQAKALTWAEEYIKYYPDEMTVYYEDDEIVIYRIHQNPYALNNFAIPYPGNQK